MVASVLLPRNLRQPFYDIYWFCRTADDLADESPSPTVALERLRDFQSQLDQMYSGSPPSNEFLALADTVSQFQLSKQPFDDLLDAFRQDQRKFHYETLGEQADYCRRSANPVGRILLELASAGTEENFRLSDKICTGLQIANFLQDVKRDRAMGRTYLTRDRMNEFGVREEMLDADTATPQFVGLMKSECERTELMFREGLLLIDRVPPWLSKDLRLFVHGGLSTIDAIRRVGFDVLRARPSVSKWTQAALVIRAWLGISPAIEKRLAR